MTRGNLASTFSVIIAGDTIVFAPDSLPARVVATHRGARLEIPLWPLLARADTMSRSDTLAGGRPAPGPGSRPRPSGATPPAGPPPLVADGDGAGMRIRLVINHLNGVGDSLASRVTSADALILLVLDSAAARVRRDPRIDR
jgi:hypothetical protein